MNRKVFGKKNIFLMIGCMCAALILFGSPAIAGLPGMGKEESKYG